MVNSQPPGSDPATGSTSIALATRASKLLFAPLAFTSRPHGPQGVEWWGMAQSIMLREFVGKDSHSGLYIRGACGWGAEDEAWVHGAAGRVPIWQVAQGACGFIQCSLIAT